MLKLEDRAPAGIEVFVTKQYDLFEYISSNRKIVPGALKRLVRSIQIKNLLHDYPIVVDCDGKVIDGQHRLEAAKELGVPIYYIITDNKPDVMDIALANFATRSWSKQDILDHWVENKRVHYVALQALLDNHPWMTLGTAVAITRGKQAGSYIKGHQQEEFVMGNFKVTDMEFALKFARAVADFMEFIDFGKHKVFQVTVSYLLRLPEYDHERMMVQMEKYGDILRKSVSKEDYLRLLEEIYNFGKHKQHKVRLW